MMYRAIVITMAAGLALAACKDEAPSTQAGVAATAAAAPALRPQAAAAVRAPASQSYDFAAMVRAGLEADEKVKHVVIHGDTPATQLAAAATTTLPAPGGRRGGFALPQPAAAPAAPAAPAEVAAAAPDSSGRRGRGGFGGGGFGGGGFGGGGFAGGRGMDMFGLGAQSTERNQQQRQQMIDAAMAMAQARGIQIPPEVLSQMMAGRGGGATIAADRITVMPPPPTEIPTRTVCRSVDGNMVCQSN